MTGFSRASGAHDGLHWQWELKSVNGKGLDVRARMPTGFEGLEAPVRELAAKFLKRGNVQVSLTCDRGGAQETLEINEAALEQVLAVAEKLRKKLKAEPIRVEALLALRGIIEPKLPVEDEATIAARDKALLKGFEAALKGLADMRGAEGGKLEQVLAGHLARIAELTAAARANPSRTPDAIRARLAEQVARLMDTGAAFDQDRLHQEAVILATRADIQEEIDRLEAHIEAARLLLASKEPSGRKFDFLAQEFNREANTLCSKSADRALTQTGLDLKTTIDQMREQVANIE